MVDEVVKKKKRPVVFDARLEVRLSKSEKLDIQGKAKLAGCSASELLRESILRIRTWEVQDKQSHQMRTAQLARIGNNLNQIARSVNTGNIENIKLLGLLSSIQNKLDELKND